MFICISTLGYDTCGEPLVMRAEPIMGQIGVYEIGGRFVGYVSQTQPSGCVQADLILSRIKDNRIVCSGAVALGGKLIITTDSPLLKNACPKRVERDGYGILYV